ncbi:MAG: YggT family protein [Candidatus Cloacimonetes bacterium]|nr:YggT family protein [Candidatus Cloacimonadota bacterium]MBL7086226.1 YggT family protein [Candidatus Cloacimonadota bacterium]
MLQLINSLLAIYSWLIIIRAIISWFSPNYSSPLVQLLIKVTEPVLAPIRKIIPMRGIDFSPIIVIIIIQILRKILIS